MATLWDPEISNMVCWKVIENLVRLILQLKTYIFSGCMRIATFDGRWAIDARRMDEHGQLSHSQSVDEIYPNNNVIFCTVLLNLPGCSLTLLDGDVSISREPSLDG